MAAVPAHMLFPMSHCDLYPFVGVRVVVLSGSNVPMVWLLMSNSRHASGKGTSRTARCCQVSHESRFPVEAVQLLWRWVCARSRRWGLGRHAHELKAAERTAPTEAADAARDFMWSW